MTTDNSKRLTAERLRELIHYDPLTGNFTWIVHRGLSIRAGRKAGYVAGDGYLRIGFSRVYYKGHDLAWLYIHGEFPSLKLDHKNRNPADNRIDNLRPATQSQNAANKITSRCESKTRGIWINNNGTFSASVFKNGKRIYLGRYPTPKLAALAYDKLAFELHGEFAILNYPELITEPSQPFPAL